MRSLALVLIATFLSWGLRPAQAGNSPQQKTQTCNAKAEQQQLQGEARKLYLKGCLGGKKEVSAQQEKMRQCNADAGAQKLKHEARKNFMKQCLNGNGHAVAAAQRKAMAPDFADPTQGVAASRGARQT